MIVVAISQRVDQFSERCETRDSLDQRLISFLLKAGFNPVPVPNCLFKALPNGEYDHKDLDYWLGVIKPQGIVLSGGNDIGECVDRDLTEGWILDYAKLHQLPVLGICRGMQMIAHWLGTELKAVRGHVGTHHSLSGEITGIANSYHSFSLANCPSGFKVIAHSDDGEIEAIRHLGLPWEGWMWHPEREKTFDTRYLNRVNALFCR
jgi:gamma-glutamyl-gamma-aminobutyrate hydrolase PuuD